MMARQHLRWRCSALPVGALIIVLSARSGKPILDLDSWKAVLCVIGFAAVVLLFWGMLAYIIVTGRGLWSGRLAGKTVVVSGPGRVPHR